jgi:hypothetical protein
MRKVLFGLVWMALTAPAATAQVLMQPAEYPQVTAAGAEWQVRGEPISFVGGLYYPVGATVFFDGNVMSRAGSFEGVPIYQDGTLAPFTVVYVPIGSNLMKPYERPRVGPLAGTVGSRTPSFPIQRDGEATSPFAPPYLVADTFQTLAGAAPEPTPLIEAEPAAAAVPHVTIGSVPPPGTRNGVWVMYENRRWYASGSTVPFSAEAFAQIGEYRGFPVFRAKNGGPDTIFIRAAADGLLARYTRE